jgi:hypothetical protein
MDTNTTNNNNNNNNKKKKKDKKKRASAALSLLTSPSGSSSGNPNYVMPRIVDAMSMDEGVATYVQNNPKKWSDQPEFLTQRDHEFRAAQKAASRFAELMVDHLIVEECMLLEDDEWKDGQKFKAGTRWKLDGHTRDMYWNINFSKAQKPKSLIVLSYRAKSIVALCELYIRRNSQDSVETTKDTHRAIAKRMVNPDGSKFHPKSSKLRTGKVGFINYAAYIAFPERHKSAPRGVNGEITSNLLRSDRNSTVVKRELRHMHASWLDREIRMVDHFMGISEEKYGTAKNRSSSVILDVPFIASLMMVLRADGCNDYDTLEDSLDNMHPNLREALDSHFVDGNWFKDENASEGGIDMSRLVNRIMRDTRKVPAEMDDAHKDRYLYSRTPDRSSRDNIDFNIARVVRDLWTIRKEGITAERGDWPKGLVGWMRGKWVPANIFDHDVPWNSSAFDSKSKIDEEDAANSNLNKFMDCEEEEDYNEEEEEEE